ncbi:FAS1 domain-containing protein [Chytridium lagenaria]|nr:FAS1 domain-containing protein [Chytridium lagenaria]
MLLPITLFLAWALLARPISAQDDSTLLYTLQTLPNITTLTTLISRQPTLQLLLNTTKITLIAPIDSAFTLPGALPVNNDETARDALMYHVIPSTFNPDLTANRAYYSDTLRNSTRNFGNPSTLVSYIVTNPTNTSDVSFTFNSNSRVLRTITFNNGDTIHFVDKVLTPPLSFLRTASTNNLTTFVTSATLSNLTNSLDALQGITVFIPSNRALAGVTGIFANDSMKSLLAYHIVPGIWFATDLLRAFEVNGTMTLPTYLNQNISLSRGGGGAYVQGKRNSGGAVITATDIVMESGVMHVIDGVLLPDIMGVPELTQMTSGVEVAVTTRVEPVATEGTVTVDSTRKSGGWRLRGLWVSIGVAWVVGVVMVV